MLEIQTPEPYAQPPFEGLEELDGGAYESLMWMILGGLAVTGYVGYRLSNRRWYGAVGGVVAVPLALWAFDRNPRRLTNPPAYSTGLLPPRIKVQPIARAAL
jgi:hypothetical protein